ncbi:MAG: hypothetical protein GX249_06875 [Firmicutes bacterium]|nr:hypothetical protein [Bacillota bacterium]
MKEKDSQTLDSLLKLLPILAASYPQITALLGQLTGEAPGPSGQVQDVIPKITQRLATMDQETKDELVKQLYSFFPELKELAKGR